MDLSRNQSKALRALLTTRTLAEAAEVANLGQRTVTRYLADPDFKAELRQQQGAVVKQTTARLVAARDDAITALLDVFTDPDATPGQRTAAARAVLDQGRADIELAEILERIEALEQQMGGDK